MIAGHDRATVQDGTEDDDLLRAPQAHAHPTTSHAMTGDQCAEVSIATAGCIASRYVLNREEDKAVRRILKAGYGLRARNPNQSLIVLVVLVHLYPWEVGAKKRAFHPAMRTMRAAHHREIRVEAFRLLMPDQRIRLRLHRNRHLEIERRSDP